MSKRHGIVGVAAGLLAIALIPETAMAVNLLSGFGGSRDYGALAIANSDDDSKHFTIPFGINYYGSNYDRIWINNNGNVSFGRAEAGFAQRNFPAATVPLIAPFWADVDTRAGAGPGAPTGSNKVWVATPDTKTVAVTWDHVGFFALKNHKLNDFQLVLRERSDVNPGDFDVEFRYQSLQWTTGDFSGGFDGLRHPFQTNAVPALVGFDAGNGGAFHSVPSSHGDAVLDLVNKTNVTGGAPGFFLFEVRNGCLPGDCATNPLRPVGNSGEPNFSFNTKSGRPIYVSPQGALGYDYFLNSGPNIASFKISDGAQGQFAVYGEDGQGNWMKIGDNLAANAEFNFQPGGVSSFRLMRTDAEPGNQTLQAPVLVLSFTGDGTVALDVAPVPLPTAWLLMLGGLGLISRLKKRV